jgi:hypothetical protein
MKYKNTKAMKDNKDDNSLPLPNVNSSFSIQSEYSYIRSVKKHHPLLSLPLFNGIFLSVFGEKTDVVMLVCNPTSPISFFNQIINRNYFMSEKKIVELRVGEETDNLFDEYATVKFLSLKGEKEVRIAVKTTEDTRSYTEETRKKYFNDKKKGKKI